MSTVLQLDFAKAFAQIALAHVEREYPHKLDQTVWHSEDIKSPRQLHPVFYGSFDWHSSVHTHWLLLVIYKEFGDICESRLISDLFHRQFTSVKVAQEIRFIEANKVFERPYGWGWLLKLASELHLDADDNMVKWRRAISPLADLLSSNFCSFLKYAQYPVRSGAHYNSAFSLMNLFDFAKAIGSEPLVTQVVDAAIRWFGNDIDCQSWEPNGDDFLSPTLTEALLMQKVMPNNEFTSWFRKFLPRCAVGEPSALFKPAEVSDREDGKIAHLDGLNLSRAWCLRSLAPAFETDSSLRGVLLKCAEDHIRASLPYISVNYSGGHWLSTYAMLALRS